MPISTSMANSFKVELLSTGHCFLADKTMTGTTTTSQPGVTGVSSTSGLAIGMGLSGGGFPAATVIADIPSTTTLTASKNSAAGAGGATLTATGDIIMLGLIRSGMAGTYDGSTTNYSQITANSDECTGTGYTAGGVILTRVSPALVSSTAYINFSNAVFSTATFTFAGCFIYNASRRLGTANRMCAVYDLNGTQTATGSTITIVMPTVSVSTAIIRI